MAIVALFLGVLWVVYPNSDILDPLLGLTSGLLILLEIIRRIIAPIEKKRSIVSGLIAFLEDRRVLFQPSPEWGARPDDLIPLSENTRSSIQQIRERLQRDLERVDRDSQIAKSLRRMQQACRDYLDASDSAESYWNLLESNGDPADAPR